MKLYLLFFTICLLTCSDDGKRSDMLVINLDEIYYSSIDISAMADTVSYIQLDDSFLLPGIAQLYWADSCFFANTREGVLKYDTNGRFLCKIGEIGDGPKEYQRYFYQCILDKNNKEIYIHSYSNTKLLCYSFSGEFIWSAQVVLPDDIKGFIPSFAYMQGDLIYFYYDNNTGVPGEQPLYWVSIKKDGTFVKSYKGSKKVIDRESGIYGIFHVAMNDSTVVWHDLFADTIYHVTPRHAHHAYLWGQGNFRLTEEDPFAMLPVERRICTRFFDTKNFIMFQVLNYNPWPDNVNDFVFYDKRSGAYSKVKLNNLLFDKRIDSPLFPNSLIHIDGREYFLCKTNTAALLNMPEAIPWGMDADDPEGNPVVALIRLKE